jgi:NAD/NADP transhydrogenase alpha subunit
VECVISTARIPGVEEPETETEEEVQHVSIPGDFGVMIGV